MIKRVRQHVGRWMRRDPRDAAADALLFADHEEIQDIARQIRRTKVEMDRSVLSMRSWARDLGRRLAEAPRGLSRNEDLRALGETVGGLAHNFNNSLAAILAYTELMLRESESEAARRRLMVIRDVALEASATVRKLQEFVSRQPQTAYGPVGLPAVIAEALELTAPRWRDEADRKGTVITVTQDMEALPPVEGNAFELRDALVRLIHNAVDAMPRGGVPGHPGRRGGLGLGGGGGEGHRSGHVGGAAPAPGRARAEPPARAGARAGAGRGLRHRRAARRQRDHRQRGRQGHHGAAAAAREPLPDHPRLGGGGRAPGRARARRARAPGGRRPAPAHRALRRAAQRGPRHHHRRQRRRGARGVRSRARTTWSSPTSACPR